MDTRKSKQGAEAPCLRNVACVLTQRRNTDAAAHLGEFGEAQFDHEFIGLGDFNFDDLLLHWNPPALFTVSFELALKPPAFLPISELREL